MCSDSFSQKATSNTKKTFEMIQKVYSESAVHCATVFHWYNTFSEGRESIRDEQMMTRTCENITGIADILKEDCRSSCMLIAEWKYQKLSCNKFCVKIYRNGNSGHSLCHMH